MKPFFKNYFLLILIFVCVMLCSYCTKKEKESDTLGIITVKYSSDSNKVATGANVNISKYDINISGVTDVFGQFKHHFDAEAILDVKVFKQELSVNDSSINSLTGNGTIRLEQGKTVKKTIYLY